MREIDKVEVRGVESGLGRVKAGTNEMADSARGANSALANMIGNATQDLGAMTGIAGSAGVAIGQMAEYIADAALGGEKLGSALKSMALVVGPIAAITAAVQIVSTVMGDISAEAEAAAVRTKAVGDAMEDTAVDAVGMAEVLKGSTDELRNLNVEATTFAGLTSQYLKTIAGGLPLIGGVIADSGEDIVEILGKANLSMYDLARAGLVGSEGWKVFATGAREALAAGKITQAQFEALMEVGFKYSVATGKAADEQKLFNVDLRAANELLDEMIAKEAPLEQYTDLWATLFADLRDGRIDTEASATAVNDLAEALGKTPEEILAIARAELDRVMEDNAAATDKAAEAAQRNAEATRAAAEAAEELYIKTADAAGALDKLVRTRRERLGAKLTESLDIGDAALDFLGNTYDIRDGIRDLRTFIKEEGVPNIFDPDDVDAGPFLDKIAGLRDPIQAEIARAFEEGGKRRALTVADQWVQAIVEGTKGKLTAEEVESLLGIDDLRATIKVAVDQASYDEAQTMLDILTGLGGETPLTASIELALAAGDISPEAAKVLIAQQLRDEGVKVPAALKVPEEQVKAAKAEAQEFIDKLPDVAVPAAMQMPSDKELRQFAAGIRVPPVEVPIVPVWPRSIRDPDVEHPFAAPAAGPGGLAVAPMALGAAPTAVGPAAHTMIPAGAGAARQQVTQNIIVQAAVIGDPMAVTEAIEAGVRRGNRLNPVNN